MNELALFAGAGGGILGGHLLGWRTVCAVERDAYAAAVLAQRQNDGLLRPFPIWSDVQTFDGRPWRGLVDVVSGGFPCQDISVAGKGAGIEGERSGLWSHMARVIGEVRPRFVFVENSPMLVHRGLGRVLDDLAAFGFDARWTVLGAADLGAAHRRDRLWLVAHANEVRELQPQGRQRNEWRWLGNGGAHVADTDQTRLPHRAGGGARMKNSLGTEPLITQAAESVGAADGRLNPTWVEWLMGWPMGWTALAPLATDKFHEWQQQHSPSLPPSLSEAAA